jgi:hypothetical protein
MYIKPYHCPRPTCANHTNAPYGFYIKKGYFTPKWSGHPVPKYQCKACKKFFSASTFKDIFRQKKPYINRKVFEDMCAGKTMRRQAIHIGVARRTILKRLSWLANKVRMIHQYELAHGIFKREQLSMFQFDEMETFISSKLKTVSVPLAVARIQDPDKEVKKPRKIFPIRKKYRPLIIDIGVAKRNAKGHIAQLSQQKYPGWVNPLNSKDRMNALLKVLKSVVFVAPPKFHITSDCDRGLIGAAKAIKKTIAPGLKHHPIKSRKININTHYDPMFYLNHVCARIRADLCRMRRKTWATSKKIENLEAHLWIYLAWNNGYAL